MRRLLRLIRLGRIMERTLLEGDFVELRWEDTELRMDVFVPVQVNEACLIRKMWDETWGRSR